MCGQLMYLHRPSKEKKKKSLWYELKGMATKCCSWGQAGVTISVRLRGEQQFEKIE